MTMNIQDLIKQAQGVTASGLPFMNGHDKVEVDKVLDEVLTIKEYGYLESVNEQTGEVEEYVVIAIKELEGKFIYGSSVVTTAFRKMEVSLAENLETLKEHGIIFKLNKRLSKNKRKYTTIEFFPV